MRTTITIDDDLLDKAALAAGADGDKNVSNIVTKALKLMVSADSKKRLLRLSGAMPDFTVPNRGDRSAGSVIDYRDFIDSDQQSMVAEDSPE
jgi:Arc/MetJ family transcription regulator